MTDQQAPDASVETDAPPDGRATVSYRYVVDSIQVPSSNQQARENGLDLNGDGNVDNQLGQVHSALATLDLSAGPATKLAVDRGASITLIELRTTDLTSAVGADVAVFSGQTSTPAACANENDTICRRHLDGTAEFVAATAPVNPPLVGDLAAATLLAGPGQLAMDLVVPGGVLARFSLIGARIQVTAPSASAARLIIAGAATQDEIDAKIYPAFRLAAANAMARDCANTTPPGCGCGAGSLGERYAQLFDTTPKNCSVSPEEISGNSIMQSVFAPDVMIGNVSAMSVGIGATAVTATFTPP